MKKKKIEVDANLIVIILSIAFTIASFIPICYCAFFDYATGDDFGKSADVHRVILSGGTLIDVLRQAIISAHEVYIGHEGTWASNFILEFQPGLFGEKAYSITPFIGLISILAGVGFFLYIILIEILQYQKSLFALIFPMVVFFMIQFMPYIRGGLFWYTGMAHYDIPFAIALLFIGGGVRFYKTRNKKYIPLLLIFAVYIGGSHYQAMLFVWLMLLLLLALAVYQREDFRNNKFEISLIIIFTIIEFIGFYFCYKAPGNSARAEADFAFSYTRVINTIFLSITKSTIEGYEYIVKSRILPFYILFLLLLGIRINNGKIHNNKKFFIPIIFYSYLIYCAMYAPGLYYSTYDATEGISGGYYDINYFVLILFITVSCLMIGDLAGGSLKNINNKLYGRISSFYNVYMIMAMAIILLLNRYWIPKTSFYLCYDFARSGHLQDFEYQMQERLAILENDEIKDVVLPEMNDDQGPFMHMALTSDNENFTNWVTSQYYNKNSVVAMPRDEYYEKYGR